MDNIKPKISSEGLLQKDPQTDVSDAIHERKLTMNLKSMSLEDLSLKENQNKVSDVSQDLQNVQQKEKFMKIKTPRVYESTYVIPPRPRLDYSSQRQTMALRESAPKKPHVDPSHFPELSDPDSGMSLEDLSKKENQNKVSDVSQDLQNVKQKDQFRTIKIPLVYDEGNEIYDEPLVCMKLDESAPKHQYTEKYLEPSHFPELSDPDSDEDDETEKMHSTPFKVFRGERAKLWTIDNPMTEDGTKVLSYRPPLDPSGHTRSMTWLESRPTQQVKHTLFPELSDPDSYGDDETEKMHFTPINVFRNERRLPFGLDPPPTIQMNEQVQLKQQSTAGRSDQDNPTRDLPLGLDPPPTIQMNKQVQVKLQSTAGKSDQDNHTRGLPLGLDPPPTIQMNKRVLVKQQSTARRSDQDNPTTDEYRQLELHISGSKHRPHALEFLNLQPEDKNVVEYYFSTNHLKLGVLGRIVSNVCNLLPHGHIFKQPLNVVIKIEERLNYGSANLILWYSATAETEKPHWERIEEINKSYPERRVLEKSSESCRFSMPTFCLVCVSELKPIDLHELENPAAASTFDICCGMLFEAEHIEDGDFQRWVVNLRILISQQNFNDTDIRKRGRHTIVKDSLLRDVIICAQDTMPGWTLIGSPKAVEELSVFKLTNGKTNEVMFSYYKDGAKQSDIFHVRVRIHQENARNDCDLVLKDNCILRNMKSKNPTSGSTSELMDTNTTVAGAVSNGEYSGSISTKDIHKTTMSTALDKSISAKECRSNNIGQQPRITNGRNASSSEATSEILASGSGLSENGNASLERSNGAVGNIPTVLQGTSSSSPLDLEATFDRLMAEISVFVDRHPTDANVL